MAIGKLKKVLICVHEKEVDDFLKDLQKEGILHITDMKKSKAKEKFGLKERTPEYLSEIDSKIALLNRVINILRRYEKGKGLLSELIGEKPVVDERIFTEVISQRKYFEIAEKCDTLDKKLNRLEREKNMIKNQMEKILPWKDIEIELEEFSKERKIMLFPVYIERPPKDFYERLKDAPFDFEEVRKEENKIYGIIAFPREEEQRVREYLSKMGMEILSFEGLKGRPKDLLKKFEENIKKFEDDIKKIEEELKKFSSEIEKFLVLYDYYVNERERLQTEENMLSSEYFVCIQGWIRPVDFKKLRKICDKYTSASYEEIEPEEGEEPPVAFENPKMIRPFELLTKLYSTPSGKELDPTPFLFIFFPIYFALCLGDAGYGIVMTILAIYFLKRIKGGKELIWILFAGGIVSIIIGLLQGSFFGDLAQTLNLKPILKMQVIDPLKNVMTLFAISLFFGILQVNLGFGLGFVQTLRREGLGSAIKGYWAWLLFLIFGILLILSYRFTSLARYKTLFIVITGAAMMISGALGDIISFSRLMALGLVTFGMALSINILVKVFKQFPYIGFILAPLIFVFGHFLSIFVNVLGAFVHSLRLQYAEFFTKFFTGGGQLFKPLSYEQRNVIIEKSRG